MIIKIEKTAKNAIEKACALHDIKLNIYTNEDADGMLTCELLDVYGQDDLSNKTAWYLARYVEVQLQVEEFANRK